MLAAQKYQVKISV